MFWNVYDVLIFKRIWVIFLWVIFSYGGFEDLSREDMENVGNFENVIL